METITQRIGEWLITAFAVLNYIGIYCLILLVIGFVLQFPARALGRFIARFRQPSGDHVDGEKGTLKEWLVLGVTVGLSLALASALYVLIVQSEVRYSALLFLGLPILMTVSVFLLPKSQSRYVNMAKMVTVFLGLSLYFFGEGLICVLMAAPLFYACGAAVVASYEQLNKAAMPAAIALLMVLCLEGVHPALSFDRAHTAKAEDVISLSVTDVQSNLAGNPDLSALPLGFMLRLGFPVPIAATGTGLGVGDTREFVFKRRDGVLETVRFVVSAGDDSHVKLMPVFDNTAISQWLAWQGTEIRWQAISSTSTKVSVTMHFVRRLDPGWYFAPLQKWIVAKAAGVLILHAGMEPAG